MKIEQWMIDYAEGQPWDEDKRQDVYVKILEAEDKPINPSYIARMYTNLRIDADRVESNRKSLERLYWLLFDELTQPDSMDLTVYRETVEERLKLLSPLLRGTARMLITGSTIDEIAEREEIDTNAVYQRLHQIRKRLEENNNE